MRRFQQVHRPLQINPRLARIDLRVMHDVRRENMKKESSVVLRALLLVVILGFGGAWAAMPMRFLCYFNRDSPHDSILNLVDPSAISGEQGSLPWPMAEMKARGLVVSLICLAYLTGVVVYVRSKKSANKIGWSLSAVTRRRLNRDVGTCRKGHEQ